jgi:hypothetical protein
MTDGVQQALSQAVTAILKPLTRVLLRNGISYGVFAELARKAFVDVAFEDFTVAGRKQTISRVAALTGLTRKEVKRLVELDEAGDSGTHQRFNRAIRVISGWTEDKRFTDARHRPRVLALDGPDSFADLVKDYSGDMPHMAMLSVLEEAGTVERSNDKVKLVKRAYVPAGDPIEKIGILGADSAELINTIDHNLTSAEDDLRYQRKVSYPSVTGGATAKFQQLASRKSQSLLEELNNWLSKHEDDQSGDQDQRKKVSLGIYYFEDDSTENDA